MTRRTPPFSTTVRTFMGFTSLRLSLAVGQVLAPGRTFARAARLFTTPLATTRKRAQRSVTPAPREARLPVGDHTVTIYEWGNPWRQPYVLFAHGWSSHGTRIASWIGPLQAAGYAVVAFDQPGHGKSPGETTTLPDFARHLMHVANHYGPAAAVLGHSMGGAASAAALANGLRADRAILLAPAADPVAAMERFAGALWLGASFARRIAAWLERETRVPVDALQAHRTAPRIGRPALIVHDLEDREVPWDEGERYARLWPGARMISTRGLGHNRIADDPEVIAAALRFLRGEPVGAPVVSSMNLPFGLA